MKVVQINSVCGYGSTGKIAVDISKALTERKIENYIFYGIGKCDYPLGIKFSPDWYVKANILKTRLFGKHGFYSHVATLQLINKLKRLQPDVIHIHNIHGHYLNVKMLFQYLKKLDNVKIIWTLHDCWSMTGHCSHFEFIKCEKWRKKCEKCPQLREYPCSLIFDRSKQSYCEKKELFAGLCRMTIVTPSDWLNNIVKQSYLKEYKTVTIHTGINLELLKPVESDIKKKMGIENKKMVLAVSMGFGETKGFKCYKELSAMLDSSYCLVMVGVNDRQISELPENVIGIKKTENINELAKLYSAAETFVNMTLEDTFPTVNIEALACGTPVVTWKTGGSPETIDENTGFVAEKMNVGQVAEYVQKINKADFKEKCIERATELFDKKMMVEKYINMYGDDSIEKDNKV